MKTTLLISLLSSLSFTTTQAAPIQARHAAAAAWNWQDGKAYSNGFPPLGVPTFANKLQPFAKEKKRDPEASQYQPMSSSNGADYRPYFWTGGDEKKRDIDNAPAPHFINNNHMQKRDPRVNLKLIKGAAPPSTIPSLGKFLWSKITGKAITKREADALPEPGFFSNMFKGLKLTAKLFGPDLLGLKSRDVEVRDVQTDA